MRPYENDEALSHILVGTTRSPGVCTLTGHDRALDWDIKAAKGQNGASSALNGIPLGEFEVSIYLVDDGADPGSPTDFDLWEDFQRLLWSTISGPKPVALPIYHPDLARNLYTEVVLRHMGGMVHDGRGGATVKFKLGEHRPAKPKPPAKAQAKPYNQTEGDIGTGRRSAPDPNESAKRELASLLDEARRP